MSEDGVGGLSSRNRSAVAWLVFFALLIFGPVEPYGLTIRLIYLIAIPLLVWLTLTHLGKLLRVDASANDRVSRAIAATIAGLLLATAYAMFASSYHTVCDQAVRTFDGYECVGDYVTKKGRDLGSVLMWLALAGVAFWYAVAERSE